MRGPRLDTACFTPALPMLGPVGPKSTRGFLRGPALPQHGLEQLAHLAGIFRRLDPAFLHHCELFLRRALAAGDDGTGVAHALAGRRGDAGNETDHGFFHVGLDPARGVLFIGPADLAHHDHRVGLGIVVEQLQHLDMLHAVHRVAADAHARGLAKPQLHQLADRFVSERARARHHADAALLVDVAGHDADLDLVGRDQAGAVRPDEPGALALHLVLGANHVAHRDAFGDADDEVQIGLDRLVDRGGGERRRHVDHRDVGAGLLLRFLHRREDRDALVALTGLFRIHTGDIAVPPVRVLLAHLGVELAGLAGDALGHHPGVLVYEDGHQRLPFFFVAFFFGFLIAFFAVFFFALAFGVGLLFGFALALGFAFDPPPAAATTFFPASAMLLAEMIGSPESARIFLPRSTLVPSRRTTSGTRRLTCFAAATTPAAITSHFMMPPKMLTRIAFKCGMRSMILKASVTFSVVAPPPTSRKFAGLPP